MDKLIDMIATEGEVTQGDMGSVGTSFKTIFARMSNVKLGKFYDETSGEDITQSLSDAETVLGSINIQLRKSKTEFNDFSLVFDQLGEKWKTLDDIQKTTIATAFAGKMNARTYSNVWCVA